MAAARARRKRSAGRAEVNRRRGRVVNRVALHLCARAKTARAASTTQLMARRNFININKLGSPALTLSPLIVIKIRVMKPSYCVTGNLLAGEYGCEV